jgi:septal ring factor EnvC (AmiA/AmiB activator)
MSQTFFDAEVVQEQLTEDQNKPSPDPGALTLSVDDFSALEERVVRTVELVKRERQARTTAEERAAKAETQVAEQTTAADQMKIEIRSLRTEREQVRQRVERLLAQLDALEL